MRATPELLQDLAARIRALQAQAGPPSPTDTAASLPFLDVLLRPAPLGAGALVELLSATDGAGAWTLGLYWARHACTERKSLVLVDGRGWFYPPAAAALGLDLEHVIVIRPTSRPDCQAALDQALRCTAVGAVVGWCDRLNAAEAQRLKLAAEAGNGLGLLLRPLGAARGPSFADLRLRIAPEPRQTAWPLAESEPRQVRIEVVRWRGGKDGQTLIVEIDDETGAVRLPPELAPAAARA